MDYLTGIAVLAHAGLGALPDHDLLMVLAAALPPMFIGTVLVAAALQRRGLLGPADRTVNPDAPLAAIAGGLSLGAAAIHFGVIEPHLADGLEFGLFFLALGWFQAIWAQVYLLRRSAHLAALAIIANAAVIGVWVVSRTIGLPFGPQPGIPEAIGFLDLLATSFEVVLIGVLWPAVRPEVSRRLARDPLPAQKAFVLAGYAIVVIVMLTGIALLMNGEAAVADAL